MPPERIEEFASLVGNRTMTELLSAQGPALEKGGVSLPEGEPDTAAFSVPQLEPALAEPVETAGETGGAAFDPAGLRAGL